MNGVLYHLCLWLNLLTLVRARAALRRHSGAAGYRHRWSYYRTIAAARWAAPFRHHPPQAWAAP